MSLEGGAAAAKGDPSRAVAHYEVPLSVVATARAAFASVDHLSTTAEMLSDSLDEDFAESGDCRVVVFAGGGIQVVVSARSAEVEALGGTTLTIGPEPAVRVEVQVHGEGIRAAQRLSGRTWLVVPAPSGPTTFLVHQAGRVVRTAWTRF